MPLKQYDNHGNCIGIVYTQAELNEEREIIIKMIDSYIDDDQYTLPELFKAIRARNK